ncbi:MAG: cyclic nucleotide-binding domain-containing protein [Rhodospirillales bacterium]|jgi:CRP/FNR family transcriptional regulator, cyclic AMP receptor protein|nr:cyclic nucleotide-binding domain-containing protein [Rhodospirillales bacterium]
MYIEGGGTKKKFLQKGEVLFHDGDPGDAAFIVDSGLIGIYKLVDGEEVELAVLTPGELFGEMAIVDGSKRMAHALAKEESVVIMIPSAALDARLAKTDPFIKALMKILVNNLRSVHQAYMRRARSLTDYMNAIQFHIQGFRLYLTRLDEDEMTQDGLKKLAQIDTLLEELRRSFKDHPDKRLNVLRETDVARTKNEKTE